VGALIFILVIFKIKTYDDQFFSSLNFEKNN